MNTGEPIDWSHPWWAPWREMAQAICAGVCAGLPVYQALNQHRPAPVAFVPQIALPKGVSYEAFIFETRTVPTRDGWHDLFNGLVWLRFPRTKLQLNALQHARLAADGALAQRGAVRDALTLFDENAALVFAPWHEPVVSALRDRDWQAAFHTHRLLLAQQPPLIFGHALMEKLVSPYKSITAHVFCVELGLMPRCPATGADMNALDACLAEQLRRQAWEPKPFVPMPVLGVPGWWPANESANFYADREVFRPPRT